MKNHLLLITLISFCLLACKKQEDNTTIKKNPSLIIKAGFMCGWGSGEDSLIISSTLIKYVYSVPAKSHIPEINKTRVTSTSEWNNILNSINVSNFLNLNYNSCNICVDGCDEWISIKNDSISHQIRFGLGFKIDSIKQLQNILSQLRSEFRN
jgi:hypothetical protein